MLDERKVLIYKQSALDEFSHQFNELVRSEAPKILRGPSRWEVGAIMEPQVATELVTVVGWWLFNGDPEEAIQEIEQQPQDICGRVFKPGEPVYSCRQCSMDPTCVFCQPCFKNSQHTKHEYKLHTSGGGGCCDCGDQEAWKEHPACSIHDNNDQQMSEMLPAIVHERSDAFFRTLLKYIVHVFLYDEINFTDLDKRNYKTGGNEEIFATVLFNDESHTFEYVIKILQKAINCDENKASSIAALVDREGRCVISIGPREVCDEVNEVMSSYLYLNLLSRTQEPLRTDVMEASLLAHQEFAQLLLSWMSKTIKQSSELRDVFSRIVLQPFIPYLSASPDGASALHTEKSFAEIMMLRDARLWITARSLYHQLLMNSLLLQPSTKKQFGELFTNLYSIIQKEHLNDDHEHSQSIASMSVQLFTAPSLAWSLIAEKNILSVILDLLIQFITKPDVDSVEEFSPEHEWCKVKKLDPTKMKTIARRLHYTFLDLKYILANKPTTYTDQLRKGFRDGFRSYITLMLAMQNMDSVTHQADQHVEIDHEWESGVTMVMKLDRVNYHMVEWFGDDEELLKMCLHDCLVATELGLDVLSTIAVSYISRDYPCVDYDITTKPVSIHCPLSRLTTALLVQFSKIGYSFADVINIVNKPMSCLELCEYALRSLCLVAQVRVGIWKRNGYALINQAFYYKEQRCRAYCLDQDIHSLQICASNMDPDNFMTSLLHKMNLTPLKDKTSEYQVKLMEEILLILIWIFCERFDLGIGEVKVEDRIKREIIHLLVAEPRPHSKIAKHLPENITDNVDWELILSEVSDFKRATNVNTVGKYELKDSYLGEFCPFYYHYNASGQTSNAQDAVRSRFKAIKEVPVFKASRLPRFKPMMQNVPFILCCDSFIYFLRSTILTIKEDSDEWTDKYVDMILYLVNMALVEETQLREQDPNTAYNFVQKISDDGEGSVFALLKTLAGSPWVSMHKEMFDHVISMINYLSDRSHESLTTDHHQTDQIRIMDRKHKAAEKRERLLKKIKSQQKNFIMQNPGLAETADKMETDNAASEDVMASENIGTAVATSLAWQKLFLREDKTDVCILCQEDTNILFGNLVTPSFIQRTMIYTKTFDTDDYIHMAAPYCVHISSCNHVMHSSCFQKYFHSVKTQRSVPRRFYSSYNINDGEFLCPLCSRLSNSVLLLVGHTVAARIRGDVFLEEDSSVDANDPDEESLEDWIKRINMTLHDSYNNHDAPTMEDLWTDEPYEGNIDREEHGDGEEHEDGEEHGDGEEHEDDGQEDELQKYWLDHLIENWKKHTRFGDTFTDWQALLLSLATGITAYEALNRLEERTIITDGPIRMFSSLFYLQRIITLYQSQILARSSMHENVFSILAHVVGFWDNSVQENMLLVLVSLWNVTSELNPLRRNDKAHRVVTANKHVLQLCMLTQLLQVILHLDLEPLRTSEMRMPATAEDQQMYELCTHVFTHAGLSLPDVGVHELAEAIRTSMLPFIRSCVLFAHVVTNVPPPRTGTSIPQLLAYLGIADILPPTCLKPLIEKWCAAASTNVQNIPSELKYPQICRVPQLVHLPHDYSDLLEEAASFTCPKFASDDMLTPTMCLVCRKILCSQNFCCQEKIEDKVVGACNAHCNSCGARTGIFLRIRDSTVVLLNSFKRGTNIPAPYLDKYGETDKGLKRGNPLYLSKSQLHALQKIWLSFSIPEKISYDIELRETTYWLDWGHL